MKNVEEIISSVVFTGTWSALQDIAEYPYYPFTDADKRALIERLRKGVALLRAGAKVADKQTGESTHILKCPQCQGLPIGYRAIIHNSEGSNDEAFFKCPRCGRETEPQADLVLAAKEWNRKVLDGADILDTQEFYEIAQTYRHAKDYRVAPEFPTAVEAFEALKLFIRNHFTPKNNT